jgi:signal transduction histidine kinase
MTKTVGLGAPIERWRELAARPLEILLSGVLRPLPRETATLRRAYANELWTSEVPVSLHHAIVVIGLINLAFIAADWWTFADRFQLCLTARLILTGALFLLWNPKGAKERLLAGLLLYSATGLMIIWVILAAGGTASEYSPGLVLLLAGIPILLPVSALQASTVVTVLLAIYTAIPLFDPDPVSPRDLVLHLSFPWAAAFGALIACRRLDEVRFADYCKRHALQVAGERLRALDEAKSKFIANVNHELRTPLTLLLLPTEELLSTHGTELSPLQREYLDIVRSNAHRLLALVNNVLAAATSRNPGPRLLARSVQIGAIITETVSDLRPAAMRKHLEIRTLGLESAGDVVGDPEALKRVLLNVVANAVKFTRVGGWIEISTRSASEGVEISTRDNGIGFHRDNADRMFDRFVRLESDTASSDGGMGLGLAIARELIELHGGRIWADSDGPGRGATVSMWIPRTRILGRPGAPVAIADPVVARAIVTGAATTPTFDDHDARETWFSRESGSATGRPARQIMVVDDNSEMRQVLASLLSSEFHVRMAASGDEALEQIRNEPPDLVLADIMMTGVSGIELCKVLKGDSDTRGIPVILVTALADQDDRIRGLEIGADDYVAKPFRARELIARIRALLQLRSVQRDLIERNKALEQAIEALNASKRRSELYARAVSHDLRGPIAAAAAAVKAATGAGPPEVEDALSIAAENLSRADRMLVALRSLTRTVATAEEADEIDIGALVADVVAGLRLSRGNQPLPIVVRTEDARLRGKPEKLGHVLRNLIDNALRAIDSVSNGEVAVEAKEDRGRATITVIDNGCGIPNGMLQSIFEPFRRGQCSKPANLGLGLALARQIVEEHGGTIEVASRPGQGSVFTVRLPLAMARGRDA